MKQFLVVFSLFSVSSGAVAQEAQITIDWRYTNVPIRIKIHEVKDEVPVWTTKTVSKLDGSPVLDEIKNSSFRLGPNRRKRFALVAHNPTDKPIHFFAAPHSAQPVVNSFGFKFKCLCVNHVFKVNPKETWYRVVDFRLTSDFKGKELKVTHDIIGVDGSHAKQDRSAGPAGHSNHGHDGDDHDH